MPTPAEITKIEEPKKMLAEQIRADELLVKRGEIGDAYLHLDKLKQEYRVLEIKYWYSFI